MSKRNRARRMSRQETAEASPGAIVSAGGNRSEVQAFTFGDPEPVLSRATMLDMLECYVTADPTPRIYGFGRCFQAAEVMRAKAHWSWIREMICGTMRQVSASARLASGSPSCSIHDGPPVTVLCASNAVSG